MGELTEEQLDTARARGEVLLRVPRAESAHHDAGRNRIVVRLTNGIELGFTPRSAQRLEHASAEELKAIEVTELGLGIHFPRLGADFYVPALLDGMLGSKSRMAARLRTAGGRQRGPTTAAVSHRDSRRGGRPRKRVTGGED